MAARSEWPERVQMMNAPPSGWLGGAFIVRSASTLGEPPMNEPTPTDPTDPLANAIADLAKAISASGAETAPFDAPLSLAVVAEELDRQEQILWAVGTTRLDTVTHRRSLCAAKC